MDFYPIQKLMNQHKAKQRPESLSVSPTKNKLSSHLSSINISPSNVDEYLSDSPSFQSPERQARRFDTQFTLSWGAKQHDKRKALSPLPHIPKSTVNTSPTDSPLNKANRRFMVHLSSEKDQEIHKIPLYGKSVLDARQENEKSLKEILFNKQDYQNNFNKIAIENNFKYFRSDSKLFKNNSFLGDTTTLGSPVKESASFSSDNKDKERRTSEFNLKDSHISHLKEVSSFASIPLHSSKNTNYERGDKSPLLEGLEDIYYKDLQKSILDHNLKSPGSKDAPAGGATGPAIAIDGKVIRTGWNLRNYKNYAHDDVLLERLANPYAEKLPFSKPVSKVIGRDEVSNLNAIETKAEVLRNIKKIDDSMLKEAHSSFTLPRIVEKPLEENLTEKKKINISKQIEKAGIKPIGGRRERTEKELRLWALYAGK